MNLRSGVELAIVVVVGVEFFSVPFEEDDKDASIWFLDHNYHETMFEMFKRINGTLSAVFTELGLLEAAKLL